MISAPISGCCCMSFHSPGIELAGLEDGVRDADLADVVHGAVWEDDGGGFGSEAEGFGDEQA